jgi:hypothetical protein
MNHGKRALAFGVLILSSCQNPAPHHEPVGAVGDVSSPSPICEAHAALDEMDTRVAVPLVPMMANHQKQDMRDHLLAVQEIVLASGRDDFAGVERAAARIGYSAEMGQMCTHMGAGAKGFTEQALAFHHTADSIAGAARQHDRPAVMAALGATLQACTACHETFRQRVVDTATWTRLTSVPAPNGRHPGG